jgi:peptide-methionine (S)-S-oxide reductase
METITLAGGCFWCTEAIFASLKGVEKVMPGYSGGTVENPSYEEVSSGSSGHAESVQISFDPDVIPLSKLLYVFFKLHDPTTLNRQGADVGLQYRSAIFYTDEDQKKAAMEAITEIQKEYKDPVVTEVTKFTNFFPAEEYHREYYFKNHNMPYCRLVIDPKIQKLKKEFGEMVKSS